MVEKIIDFLKNRRGYISGDEIAQFLGISRQALWKHIHQLKNLGYEIVAVPHLGYHLISSPDRLFDFELKRGLGTKFIGSNIYYFDTIGSTMDVAMQFALKGTCAGAIFVSETQTKGRGRLGRQWFSPKYKGIYMSLILKPSLLPSQAPILTLLAAVSICEAIEKQLAIEVYIKWPNDIVIKNKKLGGILTELNAEIDKINFVILGIGVNVNNEKDDLLSGATSLKEQKKESINRIFLLQELLRSLEQNYLILEEKGTESIVEKSRQYMLTLGKRVSLVFENQHIEAQALDIDSDGGLLIRKDNGLIQKVMAGDVRHCR